MKKAAMLCLLLITVMQLVAQSIEVTGRVTDAGGNGISNASVREKGTRNGASAGPDGSFKLTAKTGAILIISAVGYEQKEVRATAAMVIVLTADTKTLSEVVVTGVGTATSKKKLGISVESITADKLPPAPTASIDQALIGKIAGAQITSTSGNLGANVAILLRGINTINRGTSPMILLDGVELGATNLNTLDLGNIERVEVVQGAASASIYGAQGANGVIQLFSKKGKQGQLNIDFNSSVTNNQYLNIGDLRKARLHGYRTNANNEVIGGSGNPLVFDPVEGYTENLIWASTDPTNKTDKEYNRNLKYYDHYKMFFQAAPTYNNSLSVYGGKEKMDFNLSASNNHQVSNLRNNGYLDRSNFTANIGIDLVKNLKFRTITQLAYTKNTTTLYDRNVIYAINNTRAFADYTYTDPDGNYLANYNDAAGVNGSNPNYELEYHSKKDNKVDVIQSFNLNYKFPRFLELDAKYGLNYSRRDVVDLIKNQTLNKNINTFDPIDDAYQPVGNDIPITGDVNRYLLGNPSDYSGEIDNYYFTRFFQNFLGTATVRTDFEKDFNLNIPIKTSTQVSFDYRNSKKKDFYTLGIGVPIYEPFTSRDAGQTVVARDWVEPFITYGYLVNHRFEYGDIAGLSGGFRTDYSSAFGRGSKPFTFPRGDAYVRISAMNFWQNAKIANAITEWKLRAAYGKAGIQPKAFDRYITLTPNPLKDETTFYVAPDQPNPDLSVEVSKEIEVGTDIGFNLLKNAWLRNGSFSFTYWDRSTDNAIYRVNFPPSSGQSSYLDNAFGLGSRGIQASLNLTVLSTKDLTWNFTANFGKQTSKITSLTGPEVVLVSSAFSTGYVLKAGEKIGQLYGYVGLHSVDQLDPSGNPYIPKAEQGNYVLASNGWVVDKNTKQPFFSATQQSFGDPNPKFNMAFMNDFNYKGAVALSFQWDWVNGSHLYNQTKEWMYRDGIHADYEKSININGEEGAWTAFYRGVYAQRSRNGTKNYFLEDASFVRLRNVSLAVDFTKFFGLKPFKKLQLVLSGRNLLTFTKYTGMDPEVSSGNTTGNSNSSWDRGVDHNTMPNLRSYSAGVNIGF